jgi:2-keto-4-pentenoate hydratase/2-oxohepta-3-ene-1,7-dioic acid hydratase in catechol pathway
LKLVRFGEKGREKPGVIDKDGAIRDVSSLVSDFSPETISPSLKQKLEQADLSSLPLAPKGARFGAPLSRTGHFIAIGLNYADHAAETGAPIPEEPIIFSKAPNCLSGPNDDVLMPKGSKKLDWEVELAVIIGKRCDYVEEKNALDHVFGYAVCNDVSEREFQIERGGQWMKGKGCPTFGPVGPWIATTDEIADPQKLAMFLDVNGKRMQTGNTNTMIFGVRKLVAYVSYCMTLLPGDVILTGTPAGVSPLHSGDVVTVRIEGLGELRNPVLTL